MARKNNQPIRARKSAAAESKATAPTTTLSETRVERFSGPIPPPSSLAQYGAVQSDLPDRIVKMAEKEQQHDHDMEKSRHALEKSGQNYALLTSLLAIVATAYLITNGHQISGGIFGGTAFCFLAYLFIKGKRGR